MTDIPALWNKFLSGNLIEKIPMRSAPRLPPEEEFEKPLVSQIQVRLT